MTPPRRFCLLRHKDPTGVSGTGVVARGCYFPEQEIAVLVWAGPDPSVVVRHGTPGSPGVMEATRRIHGHDGMTSVLWEDEP